MLLEVKNLSVHYSGGVTALHNLSLEVAPRQILALVGSSGSGKTTLAYAALKLLPPGTLVEGTILFAGRNVFSIAPDELNHRRGREIALIMQEPAAGFNPVLTVGYHFHEVLQEKAGVEDAQERLRIIIENLALCGLPDHTIVARYPHELSGGQLQRFALAMAVSLKPKLIIADEPTSALDVVSESGVLHLFKELKEKLGAGLIFITHNLGLARLLADRVAVLYKGELRENGTVDDIFDHPQDPYTKQLIAAFRELEE